MKSYLLLIPLLFFMTSCTIDRNDEKNYYTKLYQYCNSLGETERVQCENSVKIMEDSGYKKAEKTSSGYTCPMGMQQNGFRDLGSIWWCEPDYYQQLQLKYPGKQNEIDYMRTHGYKEITSEGCAVGYTSYGMKVSNPIIMCVPYLEGGYIPSIIKDFGSGFTLSQTDDETILSYSGKVIKTWSHTPPEKVPFVWDDACTIVWKGFEKLSPENQSTGKQGVWDALTEKEKKECMKENYGNGSIYILQNNNSRFFIITESYYERANQWVFDTVSGNLQSFGFTLIESIQDTGTGIEILANGRKIYTPDFSKEITPKN